MTQENFILLTPNSVKWLEEKFQALEEKISNQKPSQKSAKDDWIPLKEFMEEIGVKSHYSVSKLESIAEERGLKFKSEFRGKRRYIHRSEVEKYYQGAYE